VERNLALIVKRFFRLLSLLLLFQELVESDGGDRLYLRLVDLADGVAFSLQSMHKVHDLLFPQPEVLTLILQHLHAILEILVLLNNKVFGSIHGNRAATRSAELFQL
jgi:hypothetical protein